MKIVMKYPKHYYESRNEISQGNGLMIKSEKVMICHISLNHYKHYTRHAAGNCLFFIIKVVASSVC